ncbi:MAG: PQQ-binding-like beta-propeller repeat protein [Thermomicrobiales bacterium]
MSWLHAPRREERALLDYWDDVVGHHPAQPVPPADAPADLAQVVRAIQSKAAAAQPKSYQDDLLQSLLATYEETTSMTPTLSAPALPARGARPAPPTRPRSGQPHRIPIRHWGSVALRVALVLLLAFLTASGIWLFTRHDGNQQIATPPVATPTVNASPDVPMYRGNAARTGVFPGPELDGEPTILWQTQLGDSIGSAPALLNGVLYVGAGNAGVLAVDSQTGAIRWTYASKAPVGSSPAAVGGLVYAVDGDGLLLALDATTGAERWSMPGMRPGNPLVLDGVVYMEDTTGAFYALDAGTGATIWTATLNAPAWKSATVADGLVYVGTHDNVVHALDASDGSEVWTSTLGHPEAEITINTMAAEGGQLFLGTNNPETADGFGQMLAFDAKTGSLQWSVDGAAGEGFGLASIGASTIYINANHPNSAGDNDAIHAFDRQTGEQRWMYAMGSRVNAAPALVGETVYAAGTNGRFVALDAASGAEQWRMQLDQGVQTGPTMSGGIAYVGTAAGTLYAIGGSGMVSLAAKEQPAAGTPVSVASASPAASPAAAFDPAAMTLLWQSGPEAKLSNDLYSPLVDAHGITYVVEIEASDFVMFGPDGKYLGRWGTPGSEPSEFRFVSPTNGLGLIDVDADGNYYVFDGLNHRIQKFDPNRTFIKTWGSFGSEPGQFNIPSGAVDRVNQRIYVADYLNSRVQVFDLDGTLLDVWGEYGSDPGEFALPSAITIAPDGSLYISEETNRRVQHFSADGTLLGVLKQPDGGPAVVYSMTVDPAGNLWEASVNPAQIVVFRPDGSVLAAFDELPGIGPLGTVEGVGFAPDGTLTITTTISSPGTYYEHTGVGANRVLRFSLDGTGEPSVATPVATPAP